MADYLLFDMPPEDEEELHALDYESWARDFAERCKAESDRIADMFNWTDEQWAQYHKEKL